MKIDITRQKDRRSLNEGVSVGWGFGFCKLEGDNFKLVQPISPCKDYLNDVVYVETTDKDKIYAYGLEYEKTGCLQDDYAYIAIMPIDFTPTVLLSTYVNNIHDLDDFFGFSRSLLIETNELGPKDQPITILRIDKRWTAHVYLISAYTYIFRELATKKLDLTSFEHFSKLEQLKTKFPDFKSGRGDSDIHNQGFLYYAKKK